MGHCGDEIQQNSNTKLTEKALDSNPKEKVKNNTYDKIKHIVSGNGNGKKDISGRCSPCGAVDEKPQPQKNKINIRL